MKNKTPTENTGASIERAAIKRHIQRMLKGRYYLLKVQDVLSQVIAFIDSRTKRTAKRKGGLGRK